VGSGKCSAECHLAECGSTMAHLDFNVFASVVC
jgi:hypothetical protein